MSRPQGWLAVVGLGPGDPGWLLPEASEFLSRATDLVGYQTYLDMVPAELRAGQELHGSDNGAELGRARHALELASTGRRVAVVSSGDPGVFAMASAVFEAQAADDAPAEWQAIQVQVVPGVTAALATAARIGAPLGHDWCCISLSDNLKPWSIVERRLVGALDADFVLALYNPVSRHRPTRLADAFALIRARRDVATPIVLGRDVGRPGEWVRAVPLGEVDLGECDMRTVIIVGSSTTRWGPGQRVFTPRWYPSDCRRSLTHATAAGTFATLGTVGSGGRSTMTTCTSSSRAAASLAAVAEPPLFLVTRVSMACSRSSARSPASANGPRARTAVAASKPWRSGGSMARTTNTMPRRCGTVRAPDARLSTAPVAHRRSPGPRPRR